MDISTVKTENGNVSCATPEGTVVHININQRSALDCLLDTFRFLRDLKKSGGKTKPSRMFGSAAHLGFGVAYISLGLVSVMLAVIICIVKPSLNIFYSGVHFWVGFPFIVSGILNLVAYKFPKTSWMTLAFISLLVNFSVSVAGMTFTVNDISRFSRFGYNENVCDNLLKGREYYGRGTMAPRNYYDYDYELMSCKDGLQKYKDLVNGLIIMTLLMMIWGICLVILGFTCKVKSFCCCSKVERTEEKDDALLTSTPSDHIIIA